MFSVRRNFWVGFQLLSYRYKVKHILWEMCYCLVTSVRDVLLLGYRYKVKQILFSVRCNCCIGFQLLSYRYKVKHILWEMCYCLVTGVRDVLLLGYRYKVNTFCLVWDVIAELAFNCLVGIFNWYVLILLGHIFHIIGNVYSNIAADMLPWER